MKQKFFLSKISGFVRLTCLVLILVSVVTKINWVDNLSRLGGVSIGSLMANLSVLALIYYHITKGLNEIRGIEGFENKRLQNFSTVYSIIILVLIFGNLYISESDLKFSSQMLLLGMIMLFIAFFAIVDIIELWKRKNN